MDEKYPYLGIKELEENVNYVVLFTEPDHGVVVMSNSNTESIKFGTIGDFDENDFNLLPPEQCVRLSN